MAKWFGSIGYAVTEETGPGVWAETVEERQYYGDILRESRGRQSSEHLNDDLTVSSQISVLMDAYAMENAHAIRYVTFLDARWKVTSVEVQYPRLTLQLGGVYNGPTPRA